MIAQIFEFQVVQARVNTTQALLREAEQKLVVRSDEIKNFEHQLREFIAKYEESSLCLEQTTAALAERDTRFEDPESSNAALQEQNQLILDMSVTREEAPANAEAALLEGQLVAARSQHETH